MKKIISIGLISAIVVLLQLNLSSCDDEFMNCVDGNLIVDEEVRELVSFSKIKAYGDFKVILIQDSFQQVKVEAEESIIPYIVTAISGDQLIIKSLDNRCLNNRKAMTVYVTVPDIDQLYLLGNGSYTCSDTFETEYLTLRNTGSGYMDVMIKTEDLNIINTGSGNVQTRGTGNFAEISITGSGNLNSLECVQDHCDVEINGSGDAFLHVTQSLDVTISGSGNVFYYGDPVVSERVFGSGKVKQLK